MVQENEERGQGVAEVSGLCCVSGKKQLENTDPIAGVTARAKVSPVSTFTGIPIKKMDSRSPHLPPTFMPSGYRKAHQRKPQPLLRRMEMKVTGAKK